MAKYKSGVQVMIDPAEIVTGKNSRWEGLDLDRVEEYAQSFEQHGQLVPVRVRNLAGDQVGLVFGFHRHAAAIRYNERNADKPMKLKCIVTTCNDEEALASSVIENKCRREATAMDDAVNQRRFREEFGWSNQKIAELYQCSPSYVSQIERLLILSPAVQRQVNDRTISVRAALNLAELPVEEQQEVLEQSRPARAETLSFDEHASVEPQLNGRHLGAAVAEKVRNNKIDAGGAKGRTLSEVRKLFEEVGEQSEIKEVKDLSALIGKVIRGSLKTGAVRKKLEAMFE